MTPEDSARLQQLELLRAELRDALARVKWLTDENEALSVSLNAAEKRLDEANAALLALTQAFNLRVDLNNPVFKEWTCTLAVGGVGRVAEGDEFAIKHTNLAITELKKCLVAGGIPFSE